MSADDPKRTFTPAAKSPHNVPTRGGIMDKTKTRAEPDIPASIIESGIADTPLANLVEVAMQRLLAAGVPIDRMTVGARILHPLFDGMSITSGTRRALPISSRSMPFSTCSTPISIARLAP
jgi:hypothetical protein